LHEKPLRKTPTSPTDYSLSLQGRQLPEGDFLRNRPQLRHRDLTIKDQHRLPMPHVIEIAAQLVFEIRDLGSFHMAIIASTIISGQS